jgi:hypothetical protein
VQQQRKDSGIDMANKQSDKVQKMVRFVVGLRDPEVATKLSAHGFSEETLSEGRELLNGALLAQPAPAEGVSPELIRTFDAFENTWFPIAKHALRRHHPEIAKAFFANIERADGVATTATVSMFVERVEALEAGAFGEGSADARALLLERGVTVAVVGEAKVMLAELGKIPGRFEDGSAEQTAATDAMWHWYLEWSGIARVVVKKRHLLRKLGFRRNHAEEPESAETPVTASNPSGSPPST